MENPEIDKDFDPRRPDPKIMDEILAILDGKIFLPGISVAYTDAIPKPTPDPRLEKIPGYKLGRLGPLPDNLKFLSHKINLIIERLNKVKDEIKDEQGAWNMGGFDSLEYVGNLAKSLISMFMCLVRIHFQYYDKEMFAIQPDWTVVVVPNTTADDFPWAEISGFIAGMTIEVVA